MTCFCLLPYLSCFFFLLSDAPKVKFDMTVQFGVTGLNTSEQESMVWLHMRTHTSSAWHSSQERFFLICHNFHKMHSLFCQNLMFIYLLGFWQWEQHYFSHAVQHFRPLFPDAQNSTGILWKMFGQPWTNSIKRYFYCFILLDTSSIYIYKN